MYTRKISLKSIDDIRRFVENVTNCAYDVDISAGRYVVDGKSIMGIFSLDLSCPVTVILRSNDSEECAPFLGFLDRFGA